MLKRVESIGRSGSGGGDQEKPSKMLQRVESLGNRTKSESRSQNFRQMRHEQMQATAMGAPTTGGRRNSRSGGGLGLPVPRRMSLEGSADHLVEAIRKGDLQQLQQLISEGANPREFGSNGETALHMAAIMGFKAAVEVMLPEGHLGENTSADVNARTWERIVGNTEEKKEKEMEMRILNRGDEYRLEDIQDEPDYGWQGKSALHFAAMAGHADIVKLLCDRKGRPKGIDNSAPELKPPQGNTALHYAALSGSLDSIKVLLDQNQKRFDNPARIESYLVPGEKALMRSPDNQGFFEVEVLERFWRGSDGHKSFYEMSDTDGNVVPASYVVKPVSGKPSTPSGSNKITTEQINLFKLEAPLVDVDQRNGDGNSALHFAVVRGKKEVVVELLNNNANVNCQGDWKDYYEPVPFCGRAPLHNAKDPEIAELLLERGANIYTLDNAQMSPLHHAAVEGSPVVAAAIIRHLIEDLRKAADVPPPGDPDAKVEKYRADNIIPYITAKDNLGQMPLHIASYWGHTEFYHKVAMELRRMGPYEHEVAVLLKKEEDMNLKDENGRTRLHHAAWGGAINEIENLLTRERKAKVDVTDKKGKTPLHYTAIYGQDNAARTLLKFKADPHLLDNGDWESNSKNIQIRRAGFTPMHHAARKGYASVVQVLHEGGADPKAKSDDEVGETPLQVAKKYKWNDTSEVQAYLRSNGGGGPVPSSCTIC